MQSTTVPQATANSAVVAPPLAEVSLNLPGTEYPAMTAVLERDDTEQQTPYIGVLNSGGVGDDFTDPESVRAYAARIIEFGRQVAALADRLAQVAR